MQIDKAQSSNNKNTIAKKRHRILAFLMDFIIFVTIGWVIAYLTGGLSEDGFGYELSGVPALLMFGVGFLLWPISEAMSGQTIGKRFFDLKVVSDDFKPITFGQAFARFFLGFLDYIFLAGIIVAAFNKQNKRIGDLVAKTVVIKHRYSS
ncbi:MAG: RDD family protein [Bacteroidota bacterium]